MKGVEVGADHAISDGGGGGGFIVSWWSVSLFF